MLAESSCQLLCPLSYSLRVQSLSIPREKSHVGRRPALRSRPRRRGTATLSNLSPGARKALFPEQPAPLLAPFPPSPPLPRALLPLSPPSLSIICLQLSGYHAHLTNDPCLRYRTGAKKSDPNQTAGPLAQDAGEGDRAAPGFALCSAGRGGHCSPSPFIPLAETGTPQQGLREPP